MTRDRTLRLLFLLVAVAAAEPEPGRVPKVYNAFVTSNKNLEPSRAFPVIQPVIHDAFGFPFQPAVFYGDYPIGNGIVPAAVAPPKPSPETPPAVSPAEEKPSDERSTQLPPHPQPSTEEPSDNNIPTSPPPPPPNTQSPIPLNQFGLPPQVFPVSRFDPAFDGFAQVAPYQYTYPNLRFYNPFDPFAYSPYANFANYQPLYRPLGNVLSPIATPSVKDVAISQNSGSVETSPERPTETPPPAELSNLNVLNYSSKDPAIPDVPPPPLPQGAPKANDTE